MHLGKPRTADFRESAMHFDIAGTRYDVAIAPRPIIRDGQPCKAKLDATARRILISDQLPRPERRRALVHELRHAWTAAHGRPADDEGDADDVAAMFEAVTQQLDRQGGTAALEALDPDAPPALARSVATPTGGNSIDCGGCGARVMVGSVNNGPPKWNVTYGQYVVARWMECEACGGFTAWHEVSTQAGEPVGTFVPYPPPVTLRTRAGLDAWLSAHVGEMQRA